MSISRIAEGLGYTDGRNFIVDSSPAIGSDGTIYLEFETSLVAIGKGSPVTTSTTSTTSFTRTSTSSTTSSTTSASTSSSGGGGIPEFPYQLGVAAAFTVVIIASFLLVRRRSPPSGDVRPAR